MTCRMGNTKIWRATWFANPACGVGVCGIIPGVLKPLSFGDLEDHPMTCKWLGSPPFTSHKVRPFGSGTTRILSGLTITMVINHVSKSWDDPPSMDKLRWIFCSFSWGFPSTCPINFPPPQKKNRSFTQTHRKPRAPNLKKNRVKPWSILLIGQHPQENRKDEYN